MLVYVSAPYSAPSENEHLANTVRAIDAALDLWKAGIHSIIPNLFHYVDLRAQQRGIEISWAEYLEWDLALLECCDVLLLLGDSPGCRRERDYAKELGMQIFTSLSELVAWGQASEGVAELTAQGQELGMGY